MRPVAERCPLTPQMETVLDLIWLPAAKRGDDIAVPPQGVRKPSAFAAALAVLAAVCGPRNESRVADEGLHGR